MIKYIKELRTKIKQINKQINKMSQIKTTDKTTDKTTSNMQGKRSSTRNQKKRVTSTASVPVTENLIGAVVGKSGNTINKIKKETNTRISHLDPNPGNGHLFNSFHISGNPQGVEKARRWILSILGNTYKVDHPEEFNEDNNVSNE